MTLRPVTVLCIVVFASTAHSAEWRGDISAAYLVLRHQAGGEIYQWGGSLSATVRAYRGLGVTAEISRASANDSSDLQGYIFSNRYDTLQAGLRLLRHMGRARPYVQVLAGTTRDHYRQRRITPGQESDFQDSTALFTLTPGAGVDLLFAKRAAVRVAGDVGVLFRREARFDTPYRETLIRLHIGCTFGWGTD